LAASQGVAAAKEFHKILDQRVELMPCRVTRPKPRRHIKDLLTLWKNADPDIPVLKQAKAEYAELQ